MGIFLRVANFRVLWGFWTQLFLGKSSRLRAWPMLYITVITLQVTQFICRMVRGENRGDCADFIYTEQDTWLLF